MDTADPLLNIVLVEDNDTLRLMLRRELEDVGHRVTALSCAEELEDEAHGALADIFLIDLNLPGEDGLSLAQRVRAAHPLAGLIVVTARSSLQDRIDSYKRGADLYLGKPIEVQELCAAVAALGRRRERVDHLLQHEQGFTLSQKHMTLNRDGQLDTKLTSAETAMLVAFCRAPGQRLPYWQLAETLELDLQSYPKNSLEVRVTRLRKKIIEAGAEPNCIEAVRGYGYQLCLQVKLV